MRKDKKQGRVKVGWILFIKFYLAFEIVPRIIECMDFIDPEGFLIEGVKPQGKADE